MDSNVQEKLSSNYYSSLGFMGSINEQYQVLDAYQPDSNAYFSSHTEELLAQPPFAPLLVAGMKNVVEQANESLKFASDLGFEKAIIVGAIPFDGEQGGSLRVCTNFLRAKKQAYREEAIDLGQCQINEYPSGALYRDAVKNALSRFATGEMDKVVLSRTLMVSCEKKPDIRSLVKRLAAKNTRGYTFAINVGEDVVGGVRSTLIGASPELLVSRRGNKVYANPLAGSERRYSDSQKDREAADRLLDSEKDRYEHALVTQAIKKALAPLCKNIQMADEPSLMNTATMWHLSTEISAELIDPNTSSLEVALAMHPTPAVCGYPTAAARKAIHELEGYDRHLFTGMVGWNDASGDGEWAVTIRCAEVADHQIQLYAGAGIVAGSCPDKELAETGAKFNTMLQALGV